MASRVDAQLDVTANPQAAAAGAALALGTGPLPLAPIEPIDVDERWGTGPSLPNDHPAWARDAISISQRARTLLARVTPVVVRVIAFWEHRFRSIEVGGRRLSVDASGSYRFEL